jgi:hypothetical protein
MSKINYTQLDEDEYFPKAEKIKRKITSEQPASIKKPKPKFKKQVKRTN